MATAKTKAKPSAGDPIAAIRDQLAELERRREDLREKRAIVAAAPRAYEEAEADIPQLVAATAERADLPIAWMAKSQHGWHDLTALLAPRPGTMTDYPSVAPAALLCRIVPDAVGAWLRRELESAYASLPEPMAASARASQLAEIDRQILAAERELAELWWRATEVGIDIPLPELPAVALLGLDTQ